MNDSYRSILRSSAFMAASSVVGIIVGLARMKAAAVFLGPAGVGLIGVLQNVMSTASILAAFGSGSSATRQVAEAVSSGRRADILAVRTALFWGTVILSSVGGIVFFLVSGPLSRAISLDPVSSEQIGWISVGVALSIAAGSQRALLNGFRRIADLALLQILSGVISAIVGVVAIYVWGSRATIMFILAAPLASFLVGHLLVIRLERVASGERISLSILARQWWRMAHLGSAFMISTLFVSLGMLGARGLIQRELGPVELGHFQAAWAISVTYLGFVLSAMGTDYYPRLTGIIRDRDAACRLVNDQTEIALLLGGALIIAMIGLAPTAVNVLYSNEFVPAANILRWQLLGDLFKLVSWPLGIVILASGSTRWLIFVEGCVTIVFLFVLYIGLGRIGLEAAGIGFLAMYICHLSLVYYVAYRRIGFVWRRYLVFQWCLVSVAAVGVTVLSRFSEELAAIFGAIIAVGFGAYALIRISALVETSGPIRRLVTRWRGKIRES